MCAFTSLTKTLDEGNEAPFSTTSTYLDCMAVISVEQVEREPYQRILVLCAYMYICTRASILGRKDRVGVTVLFGEANINVV